ncbi:Cytochrome b5 reductase 4-like isoform X5 [Oopsacas minuta]|uniref:Cytochrome b5 reductase 4-like isoform X5 n=1 Tax=Oopsacas minuta TaxID=111878 RepID=A0AAV7JD42_9METZ|nr:Cytochrome b5 reductase 4-like isoform X5 [Oopsacas minuta]
MASLGVPHTSVGHLGTISSYTSRSKVVRKPGYSLLNWIKLGKSATDLTGTGGKMIQVTSQELRKHRKLEDCWTCIKGRIYNLSHYLNYHPGGVSEIMRAAGIDGTSLFIEVHSWVNEIKMLEKCVVGHLIASPQFLVPSAPSVANSATNSNSLSPSMQRKAALIDNINDPCWKEATLHSVVSLTKDTRLFTLQLPKGVSMHVPIGYHIHLKAHLPSSQQLLRSYTPVDHVTGESLLNDKSLISLIIKIYPNGPMSSFLDKCPTGTKVNLSRPEGTFDFSDLKDTKYILILATGTGITPMTRIIRLGMESADKQLIHLVYGNKTPDSAIWLEEFNQLSSLLPDRFKLTNVFSQGVEVNMINLKLIQDILSQYPDPTSGDIYFCVCGQTDFLITVSQDLLSLNVPSDSIYTFW